MTDDDGREIEPPTPDDMPAVFSLNDPADRERLLDRIRRFNASLDSEE